MAFVICPSWVLVSSVALSLKVERLQFEVIAHIKQFVLPVIFVSKLIMGFSSRHSSCLAQKAGYLKNLGNVWKTFIETALSVFDS